MTRPEILLTNDDGITAPGIWAAYKALSHFANVTVAAPATQQSAVGRSISVFEPLRMDNIVINGVPAYSVSGKPTDCVILGLYALKIKPDLVVSGINLGQNISCEAATTSGTLGAALEASNQGYKAAAFSLEIDDEELMKTGKPPSFDEAGKVVEDICRKLLEKGYPENCNVLNVNIPKKITGGYAVTTLSERLFITDIEQRRDPRGRPYYWISGPLCEDCRPGTDTYAVYNGNVSITPLTLDLTSYKGIDSVKKIFKPED